MYILKNVATGIWYTLVLNFVVVIHYDEQWELPLLFLKKTAWNLQTSIGFIDNLGINIRNTKQYTFILQYASPKLLKRLSNKIPDPFLNAAVTYEPNYANCVSP